MRLFVLFVITSLISCQNHNTKKNKSQFSNLYKSETINDNSFSINFSIPDDLIKVDIQDSFLKRNFKDVQLLRSYTNETESVKVFVSKIENSDKYIKKFSEKIIKDSAKPIHLDTLKLKDALNIRYFYKLPKIDLISFKNFIIPITNKSKSCYLIGYVLPEQLDSTYQRKIALSLDKIFFVQY